MGKKLIFKKIRGRIIPILSDSNVSKPLKGRLMADSLSESYDEGIKSLMQKSIEHTRKIRDSFKMGDYSYVRSNKSLMEGLAEDGLKNKSSGQKIAKLLKGNKK